MATRLSGLEPLNITDDSLFVNIGERTNINTQTETVKNLRPQAAFLGIGAYTTALMTKAGVPFGFAFMASGLLSFAIGITSSRICGTKARSPGACDTSASRQRESAEALR